jgi:hypothetical protein
MADDKTQLDQAQAAQPNPKVCKPEKIAAFHALLEKHCQDANNTTRNPPPGLAAALQAAQDALQPYAETFPWPSYPLRCMDAARRNLANLAALLPQAKTEAPSSGEGA